MCDNSDVPHVRYPCVRDFIFTPFKHIGTVESQANFIALKSSGIVIVVGHAMVFNTAIKF